MESKHDIKIKATIQATVVLDDTGITAFNDDFTPTTFNLTYRNDFFYITKGKDYHQYLWGIDYVLKELYTKQGTYHVKMPCHELTLIQNRSTVYLYRDIDQLTVYSESSKLNGPCDIMILKMYAIDSVVKKLNAIDLNIIAEKYSTVTISSGSDMRYGIEDICENLIKLKYDETSKILINDILINHKTKSRL